MTHAMTHALTHAMKGRVWAVTLLSAIVVATPACATAAPSSAPSAPAVPITVSGTIARDLVSPWGLAFLPDGSALVSERDTARIKRIGRDGAVTIVGTVSDAQPSGEGGLLGLAVQPGPTPRWVYAYYTSATDNRIVRFAWDGKRLGRSQLVLKGIPKASYHDGGRLAFGPDGMLYAATGDAGQPDSAQDKGSLAGKVLRMTPEGKAPADNPFRGSVVWTLGHRNVQGLAFDEQGRLFATEFGEKDVDELNLLRKGRNYGWPVHEGASDDDRYVNPIAQWSPTALASPSGLAVTDGYAYVASLRGERLYRVPLTANGAGRPVAMDIQRGRLRTISVAPDGSLWLMTSNTDGRGSPRKGDDRILRLDPPG